MKNTPLMGALVAGALTLAIAAPSAAQEVNGYADAEIRQWEVPYENSRPRDPYVGPDGNVWFVGQRTHYVASLDPETGEFSHFPLEDGTGPHTLIVSDDGTIWYAGNRAMHIGKMDPASGAIEKIMMPDPAARDPHTMAFSGDDHIWFTLQGSNKVGRLTRSTGDVELIDVPTPSARPYGIIVDPSGRPWIAQLGTNKLGTVDPATMEYEEIAVPREGARLRRIGRTSDGAIWYGDYAEGYLGRYDPETGDFREWRTPGAEQSGPYALAVDDDDRIWFVETRADPNRFVGFDPATESYFFSQPIESGSIRHMVFHEPTRTIWFGTDSNTIGRLSVP